MSNAVKNSTPVESLALSVNGACLALSIGKTALYALFATGELRPFRIGKKVLVARAEIDRFIAARMASIDRPV